MSKFLRIKGEGATVVEVEITTITSMNIMAGEEGLYTLTVTTPDALLELAVGTFDAMHYKLNELHALLDATIIDL